MNDDSVKSTENSDEVQNTEVVAPVPKRKTGFALMSAERLKEVSRMGGYAKNARHGGSEVKAG